MKKRAKPNCCSKQNATPAAEPHSTTATCVTCDELEVELIAIWQDILRLENSGLEDNFFDCGGDSLQGAELLTRIYNEFHIRISLDQLYRNPCIAGLAAIIRNHADCGIEPCIVLKPGIAEKRLFMFSGAGSDAVLLRDLAGSFGKDITIIGCQYPGIDGKSNYVRTVPELARYFLEYMRAIQPAGPYCLAGISFGGMVAFEIARQLELSGDTVSFVGLLDTYAPGYFSFRQGLSLRLKCMAFQYWCLPVGRKQTWSMKNAFVGLCQKILVCLERLRWLLLRRPTPYSRRFRGLRAACLQAWNRYAIEPVNVPVTLFRAEKQLPVELFRQDGYLGWEKSSESRVTVHHTLMHHPHATLLAELITAEIVKARP